MQNDVTGSIPARHRKPKNHRPAPVAVKNISKPHGPLIIAISIGQQRLRVYDSNGLFAESPVSTGMAGHSTPTGVFSIIQKQKWHRSNIYSGAPMPYMQRITWSGIAIHEGVVPGYPASHGCIRMPASFAVKMWSWTRMGARVIITPGEITPVDFSHPKLIARILTAPAVAANAVPAVTGSTPATDNKTVGLSNGAAVPGSPLPSSPLAAEASSQLPFAAGQNTRQTVENSQTARADIRTADASGAIPQRSTVAGSSSTADPEARAEQVNAATPAMKDDTGLATAADMPLAVMLEFSPIKPAINSNLNASARSSGTTSGLAPSASKASAPDKSQARFAGSVSPQNSPTTAATPDGLLAGNPPAAVQASLPQDPAKPPAIVEKKRTGHIAVFISRKQRKLYVRQDFEPLFDTPIDIADVDRPLGTFVFTARGDKDDANALHWSLVALPHLARASKQSTASHKGKQVSDAIETFPEADAPAAAAALDRLTIPEEALTKIAMAIRPGGSLTISDQGLGSETGQGTDFIVPLR